MMLRLFRFRWMVVAFAAAALLYGCRRNDAGIARRVMKNVAYGNHPRQVLDLYLPAGRSTTATPLLLLIHGGGWSSGDKTDLDAVVDTLQRRLPTFAVANINYRLAANGENLFPAQEQDVQRAVQFLYDKRNEYLISNRFSLLGASAGGHLALLHAYKYTSPLAIRSVVSFFGPTDLIELYNNPPNPLVPLLLLQVTGTTPTFNAALYRQASPINFVSATVSPTFLAHGDADMVVPFAQSETLNNSLRSAGVAGTLVRVNGGGHGDWSNTLYSQIYNELQTFLLNYAR